MSAESAVNDVVSVESAEDDNDSSYEDLPTENASQGDDDIQHVVPVAEDALLVDNEDELNATDRNDDPTHYGAIESGDDGEKDDLDFGEDDEDAGGEAVYPSNEDKADLTDNQIAEEVRFAENFLESFGGEEQVLAGNLETDLLREMTAKGWEDVEEPDTYDYLMNPYEPISNTRSYPVLAKDIRGQPQTHYAMATRPWPCSSFCACCALAACCCVLR
ncbi:hypothetical protein V7S43_011215 [Phytophthora oleae]|uniref:BOP1 N-terminal domain-containing protein n=1 Tax=Phytophthora oleae TaxID=2107226 RepID=A0ABD3FCZ5_9STRA